MKRRPGRGFTMSELLVSLAVFAVLTAVLASLYKISTNVIGQSGRRIVLEQKNREAIRRVNAALVGAMPPGSSQDAITAPAVGAEASQVDFFTTDDPLGAPLDAPRAAGVLFNRVGLQSGSDYNQETAAHYSPGAVLLVLHRLDPHSGAPMSVPTPRVLARYDDPGSSDPGACTILVSDERPGASQRLWFKRLSTGMVRLHLATQCLTWQGAQSSKIEVSTDSVVQLAYYLTPQ